MRKNKALNCIIAALIGLVVTGAAVYIIWAAAFVLNVIGDLLG